jgi:GxxExxY protein
MELNDLTYKIREAIFEVYNNLGPGLLESVYEAALMKEFELQNIKANNQVALPVRYKNTHIELGFRIDILV